MLTCNYARAGLMALFLSLAVLVSPLVQADEFLKWERIPLRIPLTVGQERVIFVDKNVRVGFPPALNGKLRVQSTGGAVYLKASGVFEQTRMQLQDVENGEVILLDIAATEKASSEQGFSESVRLVYSGQVNTLSDAQSTDSQSTPVAGSDSTQAKHQNKYSAPIPVLLTRYAAQNLYAPLRTVEAVPGIHPVNSHLPKRLTTLYPSEPVSVTPLAAWGLANRVVVALRLQNTASRKIILDPRILQGEFIAATFQHRWLGSAGTPEDTTIVYIVTGARPERAFIAEPPAVKISKAKKTKVRHHAD